MNHLIAKTKGRSGEYFKVISDKQIFELPDDLDNPKDYNSDYKLEDDEWFAIDNFSSKEYFVDLLGQRFVSTEYNQLPAHNYSKIDFLCSYQKGVYYFQKLASRHLIRKKYLSLSEAPKLVENEPIIIINSFADAIYKKNKDTLYFKKLTSISSIFKGIDILYREATKEDTGKFLQNDFIKLGDAYSADKVKKANRKRIAMAMDTINNFKPQEKKKIFKYIKEYCADLEFDTKQSTFKIGNEEELKKLLYGIEQRYYTTLLGNEKRLANSVTTISPGK